MLYGLNGHTEFVNNNLLLHGKYITKQHIFTLIQVGLFMFAVQMFDIRRLGCTRGVCRWNHAEGYSDLCEKVNLTPSWTGAAFIYLGYIISTSPRAVSQGRQRKTCQNIFYFLNLGERFSHIPERLILKTSMLRQIME